MYIQADEYIRGLVSIAGIDCIESQGRKRKGGRILDGEGDRVLGQERGSHQTKHYTDLTLFEGNWFEMINEQSATYQSTYLLVDTCPFRQSHQR